MFDKFHDIIGGIHVPVDDGVDKLNRKYTLLVFLFLALPIFTKQYIGDPIECFAPVYFAEHQSRYINSYCWTQSTYYMVPVGDPEDDGDQQEPPDRIMPDEVDYFIGFETVTHIGNERLRRVRVSYYQWAPLILLAQGLCFYIPFLIWNSCANNAGVKLRRLLKKASDIASLPPGCQQREALLAEFVDQFHTLVTGEAGWCADLQCGGAGAGPSGLVNGGGGGGGSSGSSATSGSSAAPPPPPPASGRGPRSQQQQQQHQDDAAATTSERHRSRSSAAAARADSNEPNGCCLVGIPIIGSLLGCCLRPCASFGLVGPSKYLCLLYLAVKFAYVFNVGLQFFLLGQFLGRGYLRHGLELINRLIINGEWWSSPRFPLSTLCQVRADMSGGLRSYTCQCVLPINVFNEKIFSVVWFYMAFLLPLNVFSLFFWIYRTFETNRISYIRLCLWRTRLVELNQIHRTVRRLSQSYLGWDGVFLLRLIEHNHGSIMATLIMSRLWEFYANQMKLQEDANQLALASNAQHTLANITTAISSQHQLMAAAAAQQQQQQTGPSQQHHHHHHHPQVTGGGAPQHPPPPLQQHHHGGGNVHHSHHHGGGGGGHSHGPTNHQSQLHAGQHSHGPAAGHFTSGQVHAIPLQPSQAGGHFVAPPFPGGGGGGGGGQQAPLVPHSQHAHHSGQISQGPNHHPLHAANSAAVAAHQHNPVGGGGHLPANGPHLSGAFTGPNASLLAQLHHQQQQQQVNVSGQAHAQSANQQQPSGNVAAAVAALAAAAAAATNHQPGTNNNNNPTNANNSTTATANSVHAGTGATATTAAAATSASGGTSATTGNGGPTTTTGNTNQSSAVSQSAASATMQQQHHHHHHHPAIHLHSLMQTNSGGGGQLAAGLLTSGANPAPQQQQTTIQQQQHQPASLATSGQAISGPQQQQQSAASATATPSSGSQPQAGAHSATTSFINAASAGGSAGPPLPPPPPAHVVAAVAAGAVVGPASSSQTAAHQQQQHQQVPLAVQQQQANLIAAANSAPGSARTGNNQQQQRIPNGGGQQANQPTSLLFNLKSSNNNNNSQQQQQQTPNGQVQSRYNKRPN